jgi:sulfonate transport system permease protein
MALPQSTATAPSPPQVAPVESAGRAAPDETGPAKNGKPARRRRRWPDLRRWVSVLAILGLWQIASGSGLIPTTKLAAPSTVASTAWHLIQSG